MNTKSLRGHAGRGAVQPGRVGRLFLLAATTLWMLPGCGGIPALWFIPGTYTADVPCVFRAEDETGNEVEEPFTASITMTVAADRGIRINDVDVAIGEEVSRSLPTADLSFEINNIRQIAGTLSVEYLPRPTLPGITIEGTLIENYQQFVGFVQVSALADLELTDVDRTTPVTITCTGRLLPQ